MSGERYLLVGYQPTPRGEDALVLGLQLADLFGAIPVVSTVLPFPRDLMSPGDLERALDAETAEPFALIRDRENSAEIEFRATADRSPARALEELAEAERAQLIVVGSAHRGPVGRTLLGGVGMSLLHGAPCAVAVAPSGYAELDSQRILRVGVAFDGSPEATSALDAAVGVADRAHASLTLAVVADAWVASSPVAFGGVDPVELQSIEVAAKEKLLAQGLEQVPSEIPVTGRLMRGAAAQLLIEQSADLDLIVCGSRGYGPVRRTILGSTSGALIAAAACPVLVLPRAAGPDPLGLRG